MTLLRALIAMAWLIVAALTVNAFLAEGLSGGAVFITDFASPWRAQFNTDFSVHALALAGWIFYREKALKTAIPCGLFAFLLGSLFSFAYLFVVLGKAKDMHGFLLGNRA